jgi:heme/copper-type cytochrome/quinol oxidase subunit 3
MSAVTGSTAAAQAAAKAEGRTIGWYGMVFFLSSEAFFFANLIASFLYLYVRNGKMPGALETNVYLAAVNTAILLSSSFPMHWAARGIATGDKRRLTLGLIATAVLGAIFVSLQVVEYFLLIGDGVTFGSSQWGLFASSFFILTGFHGAHVTAGVTFLLVLFFRSLRGRFSQEHHFAVTAGEMYWHFVDGVWVILFSVLYIIPRLIGS